MNIILEFILLLLPILFAITIHEWAHAFSAYKLGDPTAKLENRLTFNPLRHIDPLGIIVFFFLKFGWAKPVPVNLYNLKNPQRDFAIIAFSGPLSNLISSIFFAIIYKNLPFNFNNQFVQFILFHFVYINLALFFFNLIPIPPLDGSRILAFLLKKPDLVFKLETYGPLILLILILAPYLLGINIIGLYMKPLMKFALNLLL